MEKSTAASKQNPHSSELSAEFGIIDLANGSEDKIDWDSVRKRIRTAAFERDIAYEEIAEFLGLDVSAPDFLESSRQLPKLKTAVAVSAFLGVSASWLLTGKGKDQSSREIAPTSARTSVSDTVESTVVQGNNSGTMIINNAAPMSEHKRELLRLFDGMSVKNQTRLLHFAYDLDEAAQ